MSEWIDCGPSPFLPADVVRWDEGVWERPRRGRAKPRRFGERTVTAEVLAEDAQGWVRLLVRACAVTADGSDGRRACALPVGTEITRQRRTIESGAVRRLAWSEEGARAALAADRPARPAPRQPKAQPRPRKGARKTGRRRQRPAG